MQYKLGAVLFTSLLLASFASKGSEIEGKWALECRDVDLSSINAEHQQDFSSFANGEVRVELFVGQDSIEFLVERAMEPKFINHQKWNYKVVERAGKTTNLRLTKGAEVVEEVFQIKGDGGLEPVGKDGIRMKLNEYGCLYYKS